MSIELSGEKFKFFIFLALLPIFYFSVLAASEAIYMVEEFIPANYEIKNELRSLKILNSNSPAEIIATFRVEIADSPEERERGLSGRESLLKNRGMLFVFSASDNYSFWMKGMKFSLDFIWIEGKKIVEISENIKPEDYDPALTLPDEPAKNLISKNKADKVLEVNAGTVKRLGIKTGDNIEL